MAQRWLTGVGSASAEPTVFWVYLTFNIQLNGLEKAADQQHWCKG